MCVWFPSLWPTTHTSSFMPRSAHIWASISQQLLASISQQLSGQADSISQQLSVQADSISQQFNVQAECAFFILLAVCGCVSNIYKTYSWASVGARLFCSLSSPHLWWSCVRPLFPGTSPPDIGRRYSQVPHWLLLYISHPACPFPGFCKSLILLGSLELLGNSLA